MRIRQFQELMHRLYFDRDSRRGLEGTYNWFVDEVKELGQVIVGKDKEAMENEFADVIAWLASIANIKGVDLETAARNKYKDKCPKCNSSPCRCVS